MGKMIFFFAFTLMLGVTLGFALNLATIRHLRNRVRELRSAAQEGQKPARPETTKRVVWA